MSGGVVFVALLVFAIIRAWYTTRVLNYFASQTQFQGTAFTLAARVGSFIWLTASNYLIRMLSLGFLSPIAEARSMRYIVDRLAIDGPVAWNEIGQNPDALLKTRRRAGGGVQCRRILTACAFRARSATAARPAPDPSR